MGVEGLWRLLAPCGKRVQLEQLSSQRVAVDASIWLTQFVKAMRDPLTGEVHPAAHLLGVFRRVCRLLFHRIRPVFVFDGPAPSLKRQRLAQRRRTREKHRDSLQHAAERLLLGQLNFRNLTELKKRLRGRAPEGSQPEEPSGAAAHIASSAATVAPAVAVGASSVSSSSAAAAAAATAAPVTSTATTAASSSAAARAVELFGSSSGSDDDDNWLPKKPKQPPARAKTLSDDEDDEKGDGDNGDWDGAAGEPELDERAIAALPPSERYDVMAQHRDRMRGATLDDYVRVSDDPASFSRLQVQKYLQYVQMTKRIQQLTDEMVGAGREAEGAVPRRIASEPDRRYVLYKTDEPHRPNRRGHKRRGHAEGADAAATATTSVAPPRRPAAAMAGPLEGRRDPKRRHVEAAEKKPGGWSCPACLQENGPADAECSVCGTSPPAAAGAGDQDERDGRSSSSGGSGGCAVVVQVDLSGSADEEGAAAEGMFGFEDENERDAREERGAVAETAITVSSSDDDNDGDDGGGDDLEGIRMEDLDSHDGWWSDSGESGPDVELPQHRTAPSAFDQPVGPQMRGALGTETEADAARETGSGDVAAFLEVGADETEPGAAHAAASQPRTEGGKSPLAERRAAPARHHSPPGAVPDVRRLGVARSDAGAAAAAAAAKGNVPAAAAVGAGGLDDEADVGTSSSSLAPQRPGALFRVPTADEAEEQEERDFQAAQELLRSTAMDEWRRRATTEPSAAAEASPRERPASSGALPRPSLLSAPRPPAPAPPPAHVYAAPYVADGPDAGAAADAAAEAAAKQLQELQRAQAAMERDAAVVTESMVDEVKELLRAFGVPYVVAPAEAEAQCAVMERLGLVDGVVTEDSDTFLFGAATVYRNIFDEKRFVERYRADDLVREFGLDRERLIALALLLGSDYTPGVHGIGIVNAMEVISAYEGGVGGLAAFRRWVYSRQEDDGETDDDPDDTPARRAFRQKHRRIRTTWEVPAGFPDEAVVDAYERPLVDDSTTPLEWRLPQRAELLQLCVARFGWSEDAAVRTLDQVIAAHAGAAQSRIDQHFVPSTFAEIESERVRKAVSDLTGKDRAAPGSKPKAKPKPKQSRNSKEKPNAQPEPAPELSRAQADGQLPPQEQVQAPQIIVNRAPVLTLWAAVVARRCLDVTWPTALTLGRAVAAQAAAAKAKRLGLGGAASSAASSAAAVASRPVAGVLRVFGFEIPVTESGSALHDGVEVDPRATHRYLVRSFGAEQLEVVRSTMELAARSHADAAELNARGFAMYEEFRPRGGGWGERGVLDLDVLLFVATPAIEVDD